MAKYRDIDRADELKSAKIKLEAYRGSTKAAKASAYAAARNGLKLLVGSQKAFLKPFGETADFYWEIDALAQSTRAAKATEDKDDGFIGLVLAPIFLSSIALLTAQLPLPAPANRVVKLAIKGLKPAKVFVTKVKGNPKPTTSRITGTPYTLQETNTASCPFGQGVAPNADTEKEAQQALKTVYKTSIPDSRIRFRNQGFMG